MRCPFIIGRPPKFLNVFDPIWKVLIPRSLCLKKSSVILTRMNAKSLSIYKLGN